MESSQTLTPRQQRKQQGYSQEGLSFGERQVRFKNGTGVPMIEEVKQQFAEILDKLDSYRSQFHPEKYPDEANDLKQAIVQTKTASLWVTTALKQINQISQQSNQG